MELRIKEILKKKGFTSIWLASQISITQPNMSNIVSGKSNPSLETLERIASALGVELWELFTERQSGELTAVIDYKGKAFTASTIEELENIVSMIQNESDPA